MSAKLASADATVLYMVNHWLLPVKLAVFNKPIDLKLVNLPVGQQGHAPGLIIFNHLLQNILKTLT